MTLFSVFEFSGWSCGRTAGSLFGSSWLLESSIFEVGSASISEDGGGVSPISISETGGSFSPSSISEDGDSRI
jgi:hypothetical protein